jgi:hypothetical protein
MNNTPATPWTAIGIGSSKRESHIEEGTITNVDPVRGVCSVVTASGKRIHQVRPAAPSASEQRGGLMALPMVNSKCLILYFLPNPEFHAYILGTYQTFTPQGQVGPGQTPQGPGDLSFGMDNGGHVKLGQGGLMDLMADPWCRMVFFPEEQEIRVDVKNLDVRFSPLSFLRVQQDDEAQAQFAEFLLCSAGLYQDGVTSPDMGMFWGDARQSELANVYNSRSEFLYHHFVEARVLDRPTHRVDEYRGHVGGVVVQQEVVCEDEGVQVVQKTGAFEDTAQLLEISLNGEVKWQVRIRPDGEMKLQNPEWELTIMPDDGGECKLTNGKTTLLLKEDKIWVGGQNGSEPLALGDKLMDRIKNIESFLNNHNHAHPQGPTTAVLGRSATSPEFRSDLNHVT